MRKIVHFPVSRVELCSYPEFIALLFTMSVILVFSLIFALSYADTKTDHFARGIVIQSLVPNKLGVGGAEFKTKPNLKGDGVFVYDPRTQFNGVKRYLIWVVIEDVAYPLNGPSKTLTPNLKWPREAEPRVWEKTRLDPYMASESINFVFESK